ncbi:MAG TPA: DUF3516 domain-containing protein, partial [Opitutaceae bacterium]
RLDPADRAATHTHWREDREKGEWWIAQVLVDADDANDWEARFVVPLSGSRAEDRAVVRLEGVGPIGLP